MNEQMRNFINDNLAKGIRLEDIKQNLIYSGKSKLEVDEIFTQYNLELKKDLQQARIKSSQEIQEQNKLEREKFGEDKVMGKFVKTLLLLSIVVVMASIVVVVVFYRKPQKSTKVVKDASVSQQIHDQYLPIWKMVFIDQNGIDETYYNEHIFPIRTSLNSENEKGDEFVVDFEYRIDWVSVENSSSIIIKLKDEDEYLSFSEIKNGVTGGVVKSKNLQQPHYQIKSPFLPIASVIPKSQVSGLLNECRSEMKPASVTFKIAPFTTDDENDFERFLYRGVRALNSNQVVMAEIDLETGEMNCFEGDIKFQ